MSVGEHQPCSFRWSLDEFANYFGIRSAAHLSSGLIRTRRLLEQFALIPSLPPVLHVAGTNGKGSTCAILEAILRRAGYRTGLLTSPHLESLTERIQVNREAVEVETLEHLLGDFFSAREGYTFSEILLISALRHFLFRNVDVIILETGLGGRLDPTNAVPSVVSGLTNVGRDHEQILGLGSAQRAFEKACIAKPGVPFFTTEQSSLVLRVVEETVKRLGGVFHTVSSENFTLDSLKLEGAFQRENAALAVSIAKAFDPTITTRVISAAIGSVRWPGRLERICEEPLVFLDCAHNESAFESLASFLDQRRCDTLILACSSKQRMQNALELLSPYFARTILTENAFRSASTSEFSKDFSVISDPKAAMKLAIDESNLGLILVCGSVYLAGEIRGCFGKRSG